MKYRYKVHPHARYNVLERMFTCLICEKRDPIKKVFYAWEIPIHLKKQHKINRNRQEISGWTKDFETEYLKNRTRAIEFEPEDPVVTTREKQKEIRKERDRLAEERKAKRDSY